MGAVFCDCEKKKNGYVDGSVPDFDSKLPSLQSGVPQTEIKGMNKGENLNAIWASLDKSSIVGKGVGNPKEKYEFIEQIGLGTFGQVFKVKIKKSGDLRAMKVIKKQDHSISFEKSVVHEIEMLESVDHPNVLKVFEFYDCPEHICIVSELGEGGSLSQCLDTIVKESEIVKAHIIFQLLSAINYCHSMNIMHRDIQPDNILVSPKTSTGVYNIKLIDFGTAKIFLNIQHQLTGSPQFIAPEVIKGDYNEKCDLWSCGVILYILLSARPPFGGDNDTEIMQRVSTGKYDLSSPPFDNCSKEVKDLIKSLLVMDTNKRISAEQALNHPWFKTNKSKELFNQIKDSQQIQQFIDNLKAYKSDSVIQETALAYLVHNYSQREDIVNACKLFNQMDVSGDGKINKKELLKGLKSKISSDSLEKDVEIIFKNIDADNNGYIQYEEFVRAAIDKSSFLQENVLRFAFRYFDKDNSGEISYDEIQEVFEESVTDKSKVKESLKKIISEVDTNGDGIISFEEFSAIMRKMLN